MSKYNEILTKLKETYDSLFQKLSDAQVNLEKINSEMQLLEAEIPNLNKEIDILSNPNKVGRTIAKRHHFWQYVIFLLGDNLLAICVFALMMVFLKHPSIIMQTFGFIGIGAFAFIIISEAIDIVKIYKNMVSDYEDALCILKYKNLDDLKKELHAKITRLQELKKAQVNTEELITTLPKDLEEYASSYNTIALKMANEPTMITYCEDKNTTIFQDMRKKRVLKRDNKES